MLSSEERHTDDSWKLRQLSEKAKVYREGTGNDTKKTLEGGRLPT